MGSSHGIFQVVSRLTMTPQTCQKMSEGRGWWSGKAECKYFRWLLERSLKLAHSIFRNSGAFFIHAKACWSCRESRFQTSLKEAKIYKFSHHFKIFSFCSHIPGYNITLYFTNEEQPWNIVCYRSCWTTVRSWFREHFLNSEEINGVRLHNRKSFSRAAGRSE